MLTKYINPDYRREPKTNLWCARCQKDIKSGSEYRMLRLCTEGPFAIHPSETNVPPEKDQGWFPIGMDCARNVGLEWTVPAKNSRRAEEQG